MTDFAHRFTPYIRWFWFYRKSLCIPSWKCSGTQRIDAVTPKYICTQKQNERAIRQNESPNVKTKA